LQLNLWPAGQATPKPWSSIPEELRERVDGIMLLKLRMTEEDVKLFPRLKV
jgi:C-terminal binding protein